MLQVVLKKGHLEHRSHARRASIPEGVRGSSPGVPLGAAATAAGVGLGIARRASIPEGVRGSSPGMPLRGGRDSGGG